MPVSFKPAFRALLLGAVVMTSSACDDSSATSPAPAANPIPIEVGVVRVSRQKLAVTNDLPGRTSAYRIAEVRPQVDGIILKRLFEEGGEVQAGQQLYQIDPARYRAAYDSAVADLDKAKAVLNLARLKAKRYGALVGKSVVSQQTYDETVAAVAEGEAQVAAGKAAVDAARINLDYTKVSAPISGRIGKSAFTEGALVTANQVTPLATVTQLDPIYVDVTQSSSELLKLRKAISEGKLTGADDRQAPVTLMLADGLEYPEPGELQFSDVIVDESTGSIRLRAIFPNPRKDLLPGLFVRAVIKQGEMERAILVTQKAVLRNADNSTVVWLVSPEGTIVAQPVTIGEARGELWIVTAGLNDGDLVVVDGFQKTKPGATVTAVPVDASAAPTPSNQPHQ